jgi:N-carbamoylputrescine amidase
VQDEVMLGLAQMGCTPSREENLATAQRMARDLRSRGAEVICLPELFTGPYFCKTVDATHNRLAEPVPGPSSRR